MNSILHTDEKVIFTVKGRDLDGILSHPVSEAPYPAIVLLHGSDRSGLNDPYYMEHAERLIQSGLAVLRYEVPSSNESAFETLEYRTEEAIAAIQYLQSRVDIQPNTVGLWGISQGGWICQMAAASYEGVAFIIPVSGPGVTPVEQEVYRVEAESRAAGLNQDEIAKAVLMRRAMADIVLKKPIYREVNLSDSQSLGDGPWRKMVDVVYASSPLEPGAEFEAVMGILKTIKDESWTRSLHLNEVLPKLSGLPPQAWGMVKAQMRAVMEVEPANFLTKVRCPVLAIFGEDDTSVPVEKSVALYQQYLSEAGNQAVKIKVFPKASHTIRVVEAFASGYFELMIDWLQNLQIIKDRIKR